MYSNDEDDTPADVFHDLSRTHQQSVVTRRLREDLNIAEHKLDDLTALLGYAQGSSARLHVLFRRALEVLDESVVPAFREELERLEKVDAYVAGHVSAPTDFFHLAEKGLRREEAMLKRRKS